MNKFNTFLDYFGIFLVVFLIGYFSYEIFVR